MEKERNIHENHRQRMRARIAKGGIEKLQDHELLEYLLYPFVPRRDTNPLAHRLIEKFGSLAGVLSADVNVLSEVSGMTFNASLFLTNLMGIDERCRQSYAWNARFPDSYSVALYAKKLFENADRERVYVLCLTGEAKYACLLEVARGSEDEAYVPAKALIQTALERGTKIIYILHNHMEDKARPSKTDAEFTVRAREVFKGAGIEVKDHLILARKQVFSFAFNHMVAGIRI